MTRNGTLPVIGQGRVSAMKNWRYIGMHAVAAAAFIFLLQRYALSATLESSLLWAITWTAGVLLVGVLAFGHREL